MSLRTSHHPTDLLIAEVFAAPFWLPASLELGITSLSRKLTGSGKNATTTRKLFRQTENYLLPRFPSTNLDELISIRDRIWFPNFGHKNGRSTHVPLHHVALSLVDVMADSPEIGFGEFSDSLLSNRIPVTSTGSHINRQRKFRSIFYWLSTAVPPDFLKTLVQFRSSQMPSDRRMRLNAELLDSDSLSRNVRHLLVSKGMAESHLHLGGAFEFSDLWSAIMLQIGNNSFSPSAFSSPGAEWDEGAMLARLCLHAGIIRNLLAHFLRLTFSRDITFIQFLKSIKIHNCQLGNTTLNREISRTTSFAISGQCGYSRLEFRSAQAAYQRMRIVQMNNFRSPKSLDEFRYQDPISRYLNIKGSDSPETDLMRLALKKIIESGDDSNSNDSDPYLQSFFWQYQKIRNSIYRHFVHRPMTPGLQWFIRHFARLSSAKKTIPIKVRLDSALNTSGKLVGLSSLEIRTEPPESLKESFQLVKTIYEFALNSLFLDETIQSVRKNKQSTSTSKSIEVGVVFHIVKNRSKDVLAGRANAHGMGTAGEPGINQLRLSGGRDGTSYGATPRFHRYFLGALRKVKHIETILTNFPLSLQVIRGFDACTDELGIPNWILVPLYQRMRRAAVKARNKVQKQLGESIPLPRSTIHAGEDFIHLMTGLRNIDEAIDWLDFGEGDRIGHGLALGINAQEWAQSVGDVTMSAEQRLFDLVWEWRKCSVLDISTSVSRIQFIELSIQELSKFIFGAPPHKKNKPKIESWPPTPKDLSHLQKNLADPEMLSKAGFKISLRSSTRMPNSRLQEVLLMKEYLFRRDIFHQGQKSIVVNSKTFSDDLLVLQEAIREKVQNLNIAVEVNPSSNLLLGDFGDLSSHPLWRLNSPETILSSNSIPIVIGSDDPITFASNLPQEYQKMADTLVEQGYSETATLRWLDVVRETGMRYRFTLSKDQFINMAMT